MEPGALVAFVEFDLWLLEALTKEDEDEEGSAEPGWEYIN